MWISRRLNRNSNVNRFFPHPYCTHLSTCHLHRVYCHTCLPVTCTECVLSHLSTCHLHRVYCHTCLPAHRGSLQTYLSTCHSRTLFLTPLTVMAASLLRQEGLSAQDGVSCCALPCSSLPQQHQTHLWARDGREGGRCHKQKSWFSMWAWLSGW